MPVVIASIETAVPDLSYSQADASELLQRLPSYSEKEKWFIRRLYANTGIDRRHTVIEDYAKNPNDYSFFPKNETLLPEPTLQTRNDLYIREADRLSILVTRRLLAATPHVHAEEITHLITVSCTGFSAPGFDLHIVKSLGLPQNIHRFHIGFMGCYATFPALKLAADICVARPDARVLLVSVELCSLHFQQRPEMDFLIANSLFADGAAAALVTSASNVTNPPPRENAADMSVVRGGTGESERHEPTRIPAIALNRFIARVIPDTEDDMTWKIGEHAFDMTLSAYVPKFIEQNIGTIVDDVLTEAGSGRQAVRLWAIHPGGRAIVDRTAHALDLPEAALRHSYEVLRNYGNMSSATILFVLKRILESPETGPLFAAAFGPGLTVEAALLEKVFLDAHRPME